MDPLTIGLLSATAGAGLGALASGSKSKTKEVYNPFGSLVGPLRDWLEPQIGQAGKKYEGEMVAPMSTQEEQSLDWLDKYGASNLKDNPTYQAANQEIYKTLTNQYDPATSPYYQAVKAEANRNLQEQQENIASNAAGAGRYWTGGRLATQGKAATETTQSLNTLLGSLAENERQNRLNVLSQALGFSQAEQQDPLQKATAYQTLGALPRSIQQALDTATQNEWLRSEVEYPMDIAQMVGSLITGNQPVFQQEQSALDKILGPLMGGVAQGGSAALMAKLLTPAAAASDVALKENIEDVGEALNVVNKIRPVNYQWIENGDFDGGVIAQQLEEVMPNAVIEIDGIKHIKPMMIIGVLIRAIQELSNKIDNKQ